MPHENEAMLERTKRWGKLLLLCFCPAIILKIKQHITRYKPYMIQDLKSPVKVPLRKRLWAWRRGFFSEKIVLYGLRDDNVHRYLSDTAYEFAHPINGWFSNLIDHKINVYFTLGEFREHLPAYYLFLHKNEIIRLDGRGHATPLEQTDVLLDLCREKGRLAMKPAQGSLGKGFHVMTFDAEGFHLDGKPIGETELKDKCLSLNDYIITEYVRQHSYAETLFPHTTNTLRILTVRDYKAHESFIACVRQRIGRTNSIPVDNFHQGGLACSVDIESGKIGPGVCFPRDSGIIRHERHPDTGVQITGAVIPNWNKIRARILEMADHLAMIPYMGWDVVVTEEGFKVLEINSLPGLGMFQVHQPVLDDERLRRFYETHIPSLTPRVSSEGGIDV
jgi:hypothetical protein